MRCQIQFYCDVIAQLQNLVKNAIEWWIRHSRTKFNQNRFTKDFAWYFVSDKQGKLDRSRENVRRDYKFYVFHLYKPCWVKIVEIKEEKMAIDKNPMRVMFTFSAISLLKFDFEFFSTRTFFVCLLVCFVRNWILVGFRKFSLILIALLFTVTMFVLHWII